MNRTADTSRTTDTSCTTGTFQTTRTTRSFGWAAGRSALCAIAVTGFAFGIGGCSESAEKAIDSAIDSAVDETYEVTYEVTGVSADEIRFHGGGGTAMDPRIQTVKSPVLPWKKTVTLRGIMPSAVMPSATDADADRLACTITYKGKVVEEMKGESLLTAGGCLAISPVGG